MFRNSVLWDNNKFSASLLFIKETVSYLINNNLLEMDFYVSLTCDQACQPIVTFNLGKELNTFNKGLCL